ncbi:hypothetical protein [Halioxenophilus aromaticivorans]
MPEIVAEMTPVPPEAWHLIKENALYESNYRCALHFTAFYKGKN